MEESPYSKREQDQFQREMFNRLDAQDHMLEKIETQTTKTNGRVNGLEEWSNGTKAIIEKLMADNGKFKNDRTRIYTILSVLVVVGASIAYLYYNLIDLKINNDLNTQIPIAVNTSIDQAFTTRFSKLQVINNNN